MHDAGRAHHPIPMLLLFLAHTYTHAHSSYSTFPLLKTKMPLCEQSCISGYKFCSSSATAASLGEIVPFLLLVIVFVAVRDESVMLL